VFLGRVERTGLTYVNRVVPVLWYSSSYLRKSSFVFLCRMITLLYYRCRLGQWLVPLYHNRAWRTPNPFLSSLFFVSPSVIDIELAGLTYVNRVVPVLWHSSS